MHNIISRPVIIDGVGINLKTSLMDRLAEEGYLTVRSDSSFYINNNELYSYRNKIGVKIQSRYQQLITALEINDEHFDSNKIYVDRGLLNQVCWAKLLYDEVVDDYLLDKDEYRKFMDNVFQVVNLEQSLQPIRILVCTDNRMILDDALSADPKDDHDKFRIDTYYNPQYYQFIQDAYINYYLDVCESAGILVNKYVIENNCNNYGIIIDELFKFVVKNGSC